MVEVYFVSSSCRSPCSERLDRLTPSQTGGVMRMDTQTTVLLKIDDYTHLRGSRTGVATYTAVINVLCQ